MLMPEWAREQQLVLFCQSGLLGVALGFVFDFFNLPSKTHRQRRWMVFLIDVLFCVVAAMVTFYFSLAVMDGRMHPLLFCGSLMGFVVQHLTVGRFFGRLLYATVRVAYTILGRIFGWLEGVLLRGVSAIKRCFSYLSVKIKGNAEKSQKKSNFFQKST